MDVTLQRHFAKYIYIVPEGLRELTSDICREVLRSQPEDLYTFIADYLDALMVTRENARVAARLVADILRISETTASLLEETGLNRDQANRAASIIQRTFKRFMEEKYPPKHEPVLTEQEIIDRIIEESGIPIERIDVACTIIQKAYRSFKSRREKEKELLIGMIDWRVAARSAIALYRKTGVTYEEAHRAATLIKAAYKGYYTRRLMKKLLDETRIEGSEVCVCESWSIDLPPVEPLKTISEECICELESVDQVTEAPSEECLCQYTPSEQLKIKQGKMLVDEAGFIPLVDEEESEDWACYCKENQQEESQAGDTGVQEPLVETAQVAVLYDEEEALLDQPKEESMIQEPVAVEEAPQEAEPPAVEEAPAEPAPEPAPEEAPEPAPELAQELAQELTPEPAPEPAQELAPEPAQEPTPEPTPEPPAVEETLAEPTPEPIAEEKPAEPSPESAPAGDNPPPSGEEPPS